MWKYLLSRSGLIFCDLGKFFKKFYYFNNLKKKKIFCWNRMGGQNPWCPSVCLSVRNKKLFFYLRMGYGQISQGRLMLWFWFQKSGPKIIWMCIFRDIGVQSLVFFDKKSQNFLKTGFLDELSHLESKNKKKIFHFFLTQVDFEKMTKSQKKFFFSKKISRSIFSTN